MPNLIYLYTSGGAPKCDMTMFPDYEGQAQTSHRLAVAAQSDGMIHMFKTLAQEHYVDRFVALIDSTVCPGNLSIGPHSSIHVIPSMSCAAQFIAPGDIVIVRGGFKPWIPLLDYIHTKRQNWILFYRANTNRQGWPYWDIILNDLINTPQAIRGRLNFNFTKPVNEDIFGVIDSPSTIPKEYDIMIGASHIHRKKGQHLTVQALQQYYHIYGTKPKAILPGGYMRCSTNQIIQNIIRSGDVDIEGPVHLSRAQLALAMNRSKLFVHAGYGGQNDRGILEAMCCGCVPLLFGKRNVSPIIWNSSIHIGQEPKAIAHSISLALDWYPALEHYTNYTCINGLHEVAIPKMLRLLEFIAQNSKPGRQKAIEEFIQ